jgi:myo-inositol 2-dehydrogenase/D-chiro-inositol 1-dehydrogenase
MIRCGLVGYGAWGSHHGRVIAAHGNARLVAVAAQSEASRTRARDEHPGCQTFADYRDLLAQEDINAVVIVLPSHLHFDVALAVLKSGRHLLLEKPMCLSVAHCQELIAVARAGKRVLAVGHEMRLSTLWGKVRELVAAGALGDPLYALIELWRKPYRLGANGWRYDIGRVGNWILEEPIHFFDLARWYFQDIAEPVSVYARANAKRADHPELQDHFSATVSFSGGRYAVISQSLGGWEHHQVVKLSGRDGALWASWSGAMDRTFTPSFSLRIQRGSSIEDVPIPRAAGEVFELADQFDRFLNAVQTGGTPPATGEDGWWSVRMCLAAQESVERGTPVPLIPPGSVASAL